MTTNESMTIYVDGYNRDNQLLTYTNKKVTAKNIEGIKAFMYAFTGVNEVEKITLTDIYGHEFAVKGINAEADFWSRFGE